MNATVTAEQLDRQGKQAYQDKKYPQAAQAFRQAAELYGLQGDETSAAEMANNCSVALLQGGSAQAAFDAVDPTAAVFAKAGDIRRQAMALGNRGAALEKLGRNEEAIRDYEQAAELFGQIGEHEMRAPVLQSLSSLQLKAGRQLESLATLQAGLGEVKQPNRMQRVLKKLIDLPIRLINNIPKLPRM